MKNSQLCIIFLITLIATVFLTSCKQVEKQTIEVYKVTKSGISNESAEKLLQILPIDKAFLESVRYIDNNGRIAIIDANRHFSVPTKILGEEKKDESGQLVIAESLDIERIKAIKTPDPEVAQEIFITALSKSGLLPPEGKANSRNNWLVLTNKRGNTSLKTAINTRVTFNISRNKVPIEGPGAKISASFYGDGIVSQVKYANRSLGKAEIVTLLNPEKVKEQCKQMYKQLIPKGEFQDLDIRTRLFYYAPPLSQKEVHTLIPYYECSGTATIGGQKVFLLQYSLPATDDIKYVPTLSFKISLKANEVIANAEIKGGSPPYKIRWSSPSFGTKEGDTKLSYSLVQRSKDMHEVLSLEVIDNNGVFVQVNQVIKFDQTIITKLLEFPSLKVGGVRDYGTENAVFNQFGGLEQGFKDQMNADGVVRRFSWRGLDAWEQDFKGPEDSKWIDNTDITFYVGHGNVGHFTFENNSHDDSRLDNNDATGDWGDKDLEWLALYSCQVMGRGNDGQEPFRNWKQEFDGLHLLLGFHTNAAVRNQFSGAFAKNMVDSKMTVRQAWFEAIDDHQPNDRIGIVMGVLRKGDNVWNFNDHFHGKGSVGPDIRGNSIGLGWYITGP
ncbi:MAG: hypothetical protein J7L04_02710 [Bacteroidales bacterium]|nr:hypothetical protein [Bacteroidales bacterium]